MNKFIFNVLSLITKFSGKLVPYIGSKNWELYKLTTLYYTRTLSNVELISLMDDYLSLFNKNAVKKNTKVQ
jgi:hypothetical protein